MSGRRLMALLAVLAAVAGTVTACAPARGVLDRWQQDSHALPFYRVAGSAPGTPGEIVRTQELDGPPAGSRAWRVLYHSRDQDDRDIVVSGLVIVPIAAAPASGRTIVSWAHPTTGVAAECAPSLSIGGTSLIPGLSQLIAAGDVVAAADYPGLGVRNPSSYLVGPAEGRSVLDAARAARSLVGADTGSDLVLWGHSQGGQAALFAAQEARSYAPELRLRAVAVAAPATDLAALLRDDIDDVSGVTIGSYAFAAYREAFADRYPGLDLSSILTPAGVAAIPAMARLCLLDQARAIHAIARPLVGRFLAADPATTEPWATMLRENSPGSAPIGVPILVVQGLKDTLVHPEVTSAFVARLCASGERVRYLQLPHDSHGVVALAAARQVAAWFRAVHAGENPAVSCP
jgi:pimeloyl-ACP methyl ester carboxylesterase